MAIDPTKALGAMLPPVVAEWSPDDVILYHLAIGAGAPPTSPGELAYTYEQGLRVLPTFGVLPAGRAMAGIESVDGMEFDPTLLIHGEQELIVHRPLPPSGKVSSEAKIASLYDKTKAAVAAIEVVTTDLDGEPLLTNRFTLFLRGAGGFGGDPGPKADTHVPDRKPDLVVEAPTLPQQALLYRLTGDKNPLHADPAFAERAGFDQPILHGLCTYGIVCKTVVDHILGGDPALVRRYRARFAGVVFPGETIVTSIWREGTDLTLQAHSKERSTLVLTGVLSRLE